MHPFLKILLFPFSVIYGLIMQFRNRLFEWNIFKEKQYPIPVINVGNLSVGGTGKTPHIEYLIRLLSQNYRVATVSRGYKRKSKGFIKADASHSYDDLGDEALQYFQKFPNISITVCESRRKAIEQLLAEENPPEIILLDDAFQHRYVHPSLNILLTDYSNLYVNDYVVPCGRLREFRKGASRADFIVVTKNETVLSSIVKTMVTNAIKPKDYQKLFFSYVDYSDPLPLFEQSYELPQRCGYIQIIAGIANPYPLEVFLKNKCTELKTSVFPDHHEFTEREIKDIVTDFKKHLAVKKIIVTTEKDAKRLQKDCFRNLFKDIPVFYIPIKIAFHQQEESFDQCVLQSIEDKLN